MDIFIRERLRKSLPLGLLIALGVLSLTRLHADARATVSTAVAPQAVRALVSPAAHRPAAANGSDVAALGLGLSPAATTLLSESFAGSATPANRYAFAGSTCLTAGTASTPATSVPACGASAHQDANGAGAVQLTPPVTNGRGLIVLNPALSTAAGLTITFTDYSFGGSTQGADGIAAFLTDASKAVPTTYGAPGGSLGYANGGPGFPGLANGYVGIGLDEFGSFSAPTEGRNGGPGRVRETVAVRGAAAANYRYLTGIKAANGTALSLPFAFDEPKATTRPANAATVRITLTAAGLLSVAIDHHDGKGFVTYIPATNIVGLSGQPGLPATVHFGFSSSTGGSLSRHQIGGLTIETAGSAGGPTPTPTATPTSSPTTPPSSQDNTTYHNNNLRTGWYSHETTLTAANVGSSAFHKIATLATAGKSYSQPLYLSAQKLANGSTHNVLIVTDATDVVYAYDADSFALLWRRDFKSAGVRQQLASDIGCDDNWPNTGINGTPVVDRGRNRMYVVVPTNDNGTAHLRLHALSLANGADAVGPVEVAASVNLASGGIASTSASFNFNRAGLLESNGTIYVPLSTHCDFDSNFSHGWLLAYNPDSLVRAGAAINTTNRDDGFVGGARFLGSIWQSGFGIAADAQSNVYFATGNGGNDGDGDSYAMSVLKLPPNLDITKRAFFTPSTWQGESQNDNDLGSGGVMLLPDQTSGPYAHLAIAGGKTGMKYLLNRDNLGGLHAVDQIPLEVNTAGGIYGGPAYFVDSTGHQKILYGGTPTLNAYTLNTSPYSLTLTSASNVGPLEHRNAGVTPIVSSNGTQAGSAVVWAIRSPAGNTVGTGAVGLYAFNGANLSTTLFAATAGQWTGNGDTGGAMITPLVANGRVYLATDGQVTVFGIH